MKILLMTAALLAATTSTSSAEDDPAILACEEAVKLGLKTPKSYERAEAAIVGDTVHLTFDAVNVYNAPLRQAESCLFYLSDENTTAAIAPMGLPELTAKVKLFTEKTKLAKTAEQVKAIEEESKLIQVEIMATQMKAISTEMKLRKTTAIKYPVPLSVTQVKPKPKAF